MEPTPSLLISSAYFNASTSAQDPTSVAPLSAQDYDADFRNDEVNWAKVVFSILICVIGVAGNLVSIFIIVILKECKKSVLHMYILQLAIADLAFLLTIPFKVHEDVKQNWEFPEWMCAAKETAIHLNYNASVMFLIVMSVDRYVKVCHAYSTGLLRRLRDGKVVFLIIVSVWTTALLSCLPVMQNTASAGHQPLCKCQFQFPTASSSGRGTESEVYEALTRLNCSALGLNAETCSKVLIYSREITESKSRCIRTGKLEELLQGRIAFPNAVHPGSSAVATGNQTKLPQAGRLAATSYDCNYFDTAAQWRSFLLTNFACLYVVPILIMAIAYGLIVRRVQRTKMRVHGAMIMVQVDLFRRMSPQVDRSKNGGGGASSTAPSRGSAKASPDVRRKANRMCALFVLTFSLCWLPFHALHLAKLRGIPLTEEKGYICRNLSSFASLLAYSNSLLNPILYTFFRTGFGKRWTNARSALQSTLLGHHRRRQGIPKIRRRLQKSNSGRNHNKLASTALHVKDTSRKITSYKTTAVQKVKMSR